jgi:hypothetical protein
VCVCAKENTLYIVATCVHTVLQIHKYTCMYMYITCDHGAALMVIRGTNSLSSVSNMHHYGLQLCILVFQLPIYYTELHSIVLVLLGTELVGDCP